MLVQDLHIRVINAATGELLRELTLDPTRDYQPTGRPPAHHRKHPGPNGGSRCPRCLETPQGQVFTFGVDLRFWGLIEGLPTG